MRLLEFSGIYAIRNSENNKVYVGSSTKVLARIRYHKYNLKANKHINKKLQNAWNKYGEDKFIFTHLEVVHDIKNIIKTEQKWIDFYNSALDGYNLRPIAHANYGLPTSQETRERISAANKGRVFSKETRLKISLANLGRIVSKEQIEKQRAKIIGRKPSEQELINKSLGMLGHKVSDECRRKISEAHKGKVLSDEQKLKISLGLTGKKQPLAVIEKRKETIRNMPPEKLKAWRDKLSLKNKSRVRSQYSTDKARETRKLNDALKKIRKEN